MFPFRCNVEFLYCLYKLVSVGSSFKFQVVRSYFAKSGESACIKIAGGYIFRMANPLLWQPLRAPGVKRGREADILSA